MAKYVYACIFTLEEDDLYSVRFPDIQGCYSSGGSLQEALEMAKDALCLMLYDMEEAGEPIPEPSDIRSFSIDENEFTSLVACDTVEYRKFYDNKAVKKTLTIPSWLNSMSEQQGVNFSAVLQSALKQELNISE